MEKTLMNTQSTDPDIIKERAEKLNEIFEERDNGLSVVFNSVWKNNVEKPAFTIRSDAYNACPTIYPDEAMLELTDEELADRLESFHDKHARNISIDMLMDRDYILQHVRPRLVSADSNMEGITHADIAYIPWEELGLLVTFYIPVPGFDAEDGSNASCQLKWAHLQTADVAVSELYDLAIEHISREMDFKTMRETLFGMMGESFEIPIPEEADDTMFILTTKDKLYGAALLLSDAAMQMVAERLGSQDFYILPSSVHETIILNASSDSPMVKDEQALVEMITEVNDTQVDATDRLSYNLFAHSADGLRIVA